MDYKKKYIKYKTKYFNLKADCHDFDKILEAKEYVGKLNNNIIDVDEEEIDRLKNYKVYKCKYNYDQFTLINFNQKNNFVDVNNYDFQFLDKDKDGEISKEEYSEQLRKYFSLVDPKVLDFILNYYISNYNINLPINFDYLDSNKNQKISKEELLNNNFSKSIRKIIDKEAASENWPTYNDNPDILHDYQNAEFKGTPIPNNNLIEIESSLLKKIDELWFPNPDLRKKYFSTAGSLNIELERKKYQIYLIEDEQEKKTQLKQLEPEINKVKLAIDNFNKEAAPSRKNFIDIFGDNITMKEVELNIHIFKLYIYIRYLIEIHGINYYINLENPDILYNKAENDVFTDLCKNEKCKYISYYLTDGHFTINKEQIKYLVKLIEEIRDNNYRGVMHCEAGMGRTGFIILCYLLKQEKMINKPKYDILRNELEIITNEEIKFESIQEDREKQNIQYGESTKKLKDFEIFEFIREKYNYETAEELILQDSNDLLKGKFNNMKNFLDEMEV